MLTLAIILILSYVIGSIPTSLIVSKLRYGIDIREHGSGNAGGTNVIRVLGLRDGIFVILFDIFKGYAATVVVTNIMFTTDLFNSQILIEDITVVRILAGCAVVAGHIWTFLAGFHGGKGIATACGVLIALAPMEVLISVGAFTLVFILSRYVSLGSISAAVVFPLAMFFRHNIFNLKIDGYDTLIIFSVGISLLIIFTHRSNIKRLLKGRENRLTKISFLKKED